MLVHTVIFWLKDSVSQADRTAFRKALEGLTRINTVKQLFVGTPAPMKERAVLDSSYDFALTVLFDNVAEQNAYQVDPLHTKLLADFSAGWKKVVVYDAE
ncbi:MAG: Dabb family protein [Phycisphaerae bacterium]|nr:Dabb family protein [Phycisphaerae bacterium]